MWIRSASYEVCFAYRNPEQKHFTIPKLLSSKLMTESGGPKSVPEVFQKVSPKWSKKCPKKWPQNDPKRVTLGFPKLGDIRHPIHLN